MIDDEVGPLERRLDRILEGCMPYLYAAALVVWMLVAIAVAISLHH